MILVRFAWTACFLAWIYLVRYTDWANSKSYWAWRASISCYFSSSLRAYNSLRCFYSFLSWISLWSNSFSILVEFSYDCFISIILEFSSCMSFCLRTCSYSSCSFFNELSLSSISARSCVGRSWSFESVPLEASLFLDSVSESILWTSLFDILPWFTEYSNLVDSSLCTDLVPSDSDSSSDLINGFNDSEDFSYFSYFSSYFGFSGAFSLPDSFSFSSIYYSNFIFSLITPSASLNSLSMFSKNYTLRTPPLYALFELIQSSFLIILSSLRTLSGRLRSAVLFEFEAAVLFTLFSLISIFFRVIVLIFTPFSPPSDVKSLFSVLSVPFSESFSLSVFLAILISFFS